MNEPHTVAVIRKNASEEVRISLTTFNGHKLVDIRTFADFDGSGGEPRPTKKGVTLNRDKLEDLITALIAAQQDAEREGAR